MIKFKKDFNVKIISLAITALFISNGAVYGIDLPKNTPLKLRTPLMTNKAINEEGMRRLKDAIKRELNYHEYVNEYIALQAEAQYKTFCNERQLEKNPESLQEFYNSLPKYPDTDITIMEIHGLYENTRILEHIGLGRFYDKPIIYIDSSLKPDEKEIVKGHGYNEITGWSQEKANRGIEEWGKMRDFIITNYYNFEYEKIRANIHNEANRNHNVDPILKKYEAIHTSDLLLHIARMPFKEGDVVIAAGQQGKDILHENRKDQADKLVTEGEAARQQWQYNTAKSAWGAAISIYNEIGEFELAKTVQVMLDRLEEETRHRRVRDQI